MKFGTRILNSGAVTAVEMDEEVSQEGGYLQPKQQQANWPSGGAGHSHVIAEWPPHFPGGSLLRG